MLEEGVGQCLHVLLSAPDRFPLSLRLCICVLSLAPDVRNLLSSYSISILLFLSFCSVFLPSTAIFLMGLHHHLRPLLFLVLLYSSSSSFFILLLPLLPPPPPPPPPSHRPLFQPLTTLILFCFCFSSQLPSLLCRVMLLSLLGSIVCYISLLSELNLLSFAFRSSSCSAPFLLLRLLSSHLVFSLIISIRKK